VASPSVSPKREPSPIVGGYDFENGLPELPPTAVQWIAKAFPGVVTLAKATEDLINPDFALPPKLLGALAAASAGHLLILSGARVRIENLDTAGPYVVLLPVDRLFEVRAAAALRLWQGLAGRRPAPDLGALPQERRKRFILALRALDARLAGTTYPDIAAGLFNTEPISKRDWISHELRDQTGRLVRRGVFLMKGGYRQLLLYPYRRRI
jgi:hypothetical protein